MNRALIALAGGLSLSTLAHATGAPVAVAAPAISTAGSLLQVFIGLVAVLLLIAATAWVAKRLGVTRGGSSSLLHVISSTSVGTRERVVVIEIGESWLVVGVAPGSVNALMTLPKGEAQPIATPAINASFAALMPFKERLQQMIEGAGLPAFTSTPGPGGGQTYTLSLQTMLLLTSLSFLPAALLMMTSFTRIIIVLSLLRQALGTQSSPPNQVLIGLSLFLTLFVMGPTMDKIYVEAYQPLSENRIQMSEALDKGAAPLRAFMLKQTRETDLALFVKMSGSAAPKTAADVPLRVLIPAYITSELKTAFQIGFAVFIPFLVIDMVVASILMAMGMMMVSPAIVSLPFKIILFVLVDGWNLLLGSLAQSFY